MPKVKLNLIGKGPYIEAPVFCPYKETDLPHIDLSSLFFASSDSSFGVPLTLEENSLFVNKIHPGICSLCKYCTFVSQITEDITEEDTEMFVKYLTEFNSRISSSITRQMNFLLTTGRQPLSITLSANILQQMLQYRFPNDVPKQQKLLSQYSINESLLCRAFGLPVYINSKLTKSPVMVVGEIEWK